MADPYEKIECIGKGSFGEVYRGREVATGKVVALKLIDLEKADEEIEVLQREIKVMSQISNPYVVQYYSSLMKGSTLWIVMEFMSEGSLKELLDVVGPFPEDAIATVMKALFRGLDYVHKGHKLHRDIKAANILLSGHGDVKLADFGVAGQMTATMRQRNTFVGSPFWMAPEVIQESLYDEKADIWSAGVTGIELATGLPPYATEHPYRALFFIPKNPPPRLDGPHFSRACKDFISLCLKKNPAERPSAEQLLTHPFLKKARASSIKDLLKKKHMHSAEDTTETLVIGGDTFIGSPNGTFRARVSAQEAPTDVQKNLRTWEFDFGSLRDSQVEGKEREREAPEDEERQVEKPKSGDGEAVAGENRRGEDERVGGTEAPVAPENKVLSELILPVISQMRADVGICGSYNHGLISSLGALEVAFVDAETAKPGVSTLLLEALYTEGMRSTSPEIRSMLSRVLQRQGQNGA